MRIDQPDRGPESLREILASLFTARGWGKRQARLKLDRAWASAAGDHANHSKVLALRRGILEIEVDSSVMLQELAHFRKKELLSALKERLPGHNIKDLRFRACS